MTAVDTEMNRQDDLTNGHFCERELTGQAKLESCRSVL